MDNSQTFSMIDKGKMKLELTSGKILQVNDVYHVSNFRRNLLSMNILNKVSQNCFKSNGSIISKKEEYGKRYCNENLFLLIVASILNKTAYTSVSVYLIESLSFGMKS